MDGERPGPLSYDVTAPSGDAGTEKSIVVAIVVLLALLLVGLGLGWFLLGYVAASRLVVDGIPLVMVAGTIALAWRTSRFALPRARRRALLIVSVCAVLAGALAYRSLSTIKPALPQIRHSIDAVPLPAGFRLLDEQTHGDRFCRHGCPTLDRVYAVPAADHDPVRTMILAMFDHGWRPATQDIAPEDSTIAVRNGVTAQLQEREGHVVEVTVSRDSS